MKEIYIKSSAEEEKHICSICGEEYIGYGNNAQPVNDGRCCDECNRKTVIPIRVILMNSKGRSTEGNYFLQQQD